MQTFTRGDQFWTAACFVWTTNSLQSLLGMNIHLTDIFCSGLKHAGGFMIVSSDLQIPCPKKVCWGPTLHHCGEPLLFRGTLVPYWYQDQPQETHYATNNFLFWDHDSWETLRTSFLPNCLYVATMVGGLFSWRLLPPTVLEVCLSVMSKFLSWEDDPWAIQIITDLDLLPFGNKMEVSWIFGLPPVIIHWLGAIFSLIKSHKPSILDWDFP